MRHQITMLVPLPARCARPVEHGAYASKAGQRVGRVERRKAGQRFGPATPALSETSEASAMIGSGGKTGWLDALTGLDRSVAEHCGCSDNPKLRICAAA